MGNIHPNHSHLSESPHVTTHNKHHELKLYTWIDQIPLERNETIFGDIYWRQNHDIPMIQNNFDWNHNNISPNHRKHPSESSGIFSMHLSESCVRTNIAKIYELQTTVHVVRPHADKVAAKVIVSTYGESETASKWRNQSYSIMDHVTYILFTTGIRMDEYHPCYFATTSLIAWAQA